MRFPASVAKTPALESYVMVKEGETSSSSSSQPPTKEQLFARTHITMMEATAGNGQLSGGGKKKKGGKKQKQAPLAKEGQAISKFFNENAGRPVPHLLTLEQSITAALTSNLGTFATTSAVGANVYAAAYFYLTDFPNYPEYTGLFDQYKFDQLEVWLEPVAAAGTTVFAEVVSAVDLDDGNVPASAGVVLGKQGAITGMGGAGHYHRWKPHVAVGMYAGAFTSYGNYPAGWLDSASPSVQHFGLKAVLYPTPVGIVYNLIVRAIISFRAPGI